MHGTPPQRSSEPCEKFNGHVRRTAGCQEPIGIFFWEVVGQTKRNFSDFSGNATMNARDDTLTAQVYTKTFEI
jgi:hypothetical protein